MGEGERVGEGGARLDMKHGVMEGGAKGNFQKGASFGMGELEVFLGFSTALEDNAVWLAEEEGEGHSLNEVSAQVFFLQVEVPFVFEFRSHQAKLPPPVLGDALEAEDDPQHNRAGKKRSHDEPHRIGAGAKKSHRKGNEQDPSEEGCHCPEAPYVGRPTHGIILTLFFYSHCLRGAGRSSPRACFLGMDFSKGCEFYLLWVL